MPDSFWGNIFRRAQSEPDPDALFRAVPIFEDLDRRELDAVKRIMHRREYPSGEVIFRQGEPGVGMYVVQRGSVAITYEPTGEVLAHLFVGDFFGEIALLNETPRSATARAETGCVLWGLFQPDLLDLVERNPRLGVKLLLPLSRIAGQRLVRSDEKVQELRRQLQQASESPELKLDNSDATHPPLD